MNIRAEGIGHQGLCSLRGERFTEFLSHDEDLEDPVEQAVWLSVGAALDNSLTPSAEDSTP